MSLNKIMLFSFPFFCFARMAAMEETQQSIQQKLDKLDVNIITMTKKLKLIEPQKINDQRAYENYLQNYNDAWNNTPKWKLLIKTPAQFDADAPEVRNYKGDFVQWSIPVELNRYTNTGSEGKYNNLLKVLLYNEAMHRRCKENFKRGKRQQNLEFLQLIDKDLQDHLETHI